MINLDEVAIMELFIMPSPRLLLPLDALYSGSQVFGAPTAKLVLSLLKQHSNFSDRKCFWDAMDGRGS